jgi:hypothetical protein
MSLQVTEFRQQKDAFFKRHPHSPIPAAERAKFAGLRYYNYNPDLVFHLMPEEFEEKQPVQMQTSTGDVQDYLRWGRIHFEVNGETVALTLYFSPRSGHFFVPFMDATSGKETYGAGRYLDPDLNPDGTMDIDFNLAYAPYCAYNEHYSCPVPPAENRLKVPIRAGEINLEPSE